MAIVTLPYLLPFNVDMLSEASDFEIINTKHEDEDKHVKDSRAER